MEGKADHQERIRKVRSILWPTKGRQKKKVTGRIQIGRVPQRWRPLLLGNLMQIARQEVRYTYYDPDHKQVAAVVEALARRFRALGDDEDPTALVRHFIAVVRQGDMFDTSRRYGTIINARRRERRIARGQQRDVVMRRRHGPRDDRGDERASGPRDVVESRAEARRDLDSTSPRPLPSSIDDDWLERQAEARGLVYDFGLGDSGELVVDLFDSARGELRARYQESNKSYESYERCQ